MNLSDLVKNGALMPVKVSGAAIAVNDLVQIGGPGLKAYPVKTIDYAVKAAAQTIIGQTSLAAAASVGFTRQAAVTDRYGNLYVIVADTVYKRSPVGAALGSALVFSAALIGAQLIQLSSGIFVAAGVLASSGAIQFTLFDAGLTTVNSKLQVAVGTTYNSSGVSYFDVVPLAAGGFAFLYMNSTSTQALLQTYDNSGAAVLAATTVQNFGGSVSAVMHVRLTQLSNGNLVGVFKGNPNITPSGVTFDIFTIGGASVVANTLADSSTFAGNAGFVEVSALPGFFAIAAAGQAGMHCEVYSNAGALQGAPFTAAGNAQNPGSCCNVRLLNDGAQFWVAHTNGTATEVDKVPTTGTGFVAGVGGVIGSTGGAAGLDAAIVGGVMIIATCSAVTTVAMSYFYVSLADMEMGLVAATQINAALVGAAATTTGTRWPRVIFVGDFTAVIVYDQQTVAGTFFSIIKVAPSAIVGVSQGASAAGGVGTFAAPTTVPVNVGPGAYTINPILGTAGSTYSHASCALAGGSGKLFNNSVSLAGISAQRNIN